MGTMGNQTLITVNILFGETLCRGCSGYEMLAFKIFALIVQGSKISPCFHLVFCLLPVYSCP